MSKFRIGHSWDVHQTIPGEQITLGGITIKHNKSLKGHSDADVVLHVVAESILGSLALGDLGTIFPDDDMSIKGIDSKKIVSKAVELMKEKHYEIGNIDITLFAEKPKMKEYKLPIRECIAQLLETSVENVSFKATTYEKKGFIGKEEAIAAEAVCIVTALK